MERLLRELREIDWNWRNFGWPEWLMLAMLAASVALLVLSSILTGETSTVVSAALSVVAYVCFFVTMNLQRQKGWVRPRFELERLDPADRPLRLALGLGFLVLLAVLGLIVLFAG